MATINEIILGSLGLIGYWALDDGAGAATASDQSANNNDANTIGSNIKPGVDGPAWEAGKAFGASRLNNYDTTNTTVTAPWIAAYSVDHTFSVEFCVRYQHAMYTAAGTQQLVGGSGAHTWWQFDTVLVSGVRYPSLQVRGVGEVVRGTSGIADCSKWHHVVFTMNGSSATTKIYLDGVDVTGTITDQAISTLPTAWQLMNTAYNPYACAHVAFYNRALSPAEVTSRWNALEDLRRQRVRRIRYGIHQDAMYASTSGYWTSDMITLADLNTDMIRFSLLWDITEPTQGTYDWTRTDALVDLCNQYRIMPLFIVVRSPQWANGDANQWTIPGTGVDATFQAWVANYQTWLTDFVNRYKPGGSGTNLWCGGSDFWMEMWNEPNLVGFWAPAYNTDQYAYWYNSCRSAILAAYPKAKVIFGGLSGWSASGSIAGRNFFQQVVGSTQWQSAGIDYMGVHCYPNSNDPTNTAQFQNHSHDLCDVRDLLFEKGFTTTQVCMTEASVQNTTSDADQASKTQELLQRIHDNWTPFLAMDIRFILYNASFLPDSILNSIPTDGTLGTDRRAVATTIEDFMLGLPIAAWTPRSTVISG